MSAYPIMIGGTAYVGFFVIQVFLKPSEKMLAVLSLALSFGMFVIFPGIVSFVMFVFGMVLGTFIEVFLGLIARQQHWDGGASLFGCPLWLPFIWGSAFIFIASLGMYMQQVL